MKYDSYVKYALLTRDIFLIKYVLTYMTCITHEM